MSAAAATNGSLLDRYHAEWRILREHPHNVLLEGPVAATEAILRLLHPHIRQPAVSTRRRAPLDLPDVGETGALILRGADALSAADQRRLFEWLSGTGSGTQVISTTRRPLFALVASGLFDAALYYRLNVMLLQVGSRQPPKSANDAAEGMSHGIDNPISMSTPQPA